jgi:hypothetical protein
MVRFYHAPLSPLVLFSSFLVLVLGGMTARSAEAATYIRGDGLLQVDGEPFFPVGLLELGPTRYEDWNDRIRRSGANLVWDIELAYADTMPGCGAVLDSALATGYRLMLGSGDTWNWDDIFTPELEVDQMMYELDEFATLLDCVDSRPGAVIAWANRDEPVWTIDREMIGDIDEPHIFDTYAQLRTADPSSVVSMSFAPAHVSGDLATWKADIAAMVPATDVVMFASYPYPPGPGTCGEWNVLGYPDCPMDRLPESVDIFVGELNEPGQPLWMIIQAHKGIPRQEARWEAYASIIHGATGVLWAGWTWSHPAGGGPPNWPVIEGVIAEVASLHPFLVGAELSGSYATEPLVDTRAKWGTGTDAIVMAVSREGFAGTTQIRLPRTQRVTEVEVVGEDRTLPVVDGMVTDTFAAYEAHVYRYSGLRNASWGGGATDAPVVDPARDAFRIRAFPNPSPGQVFARFELPEPTAAVFSVIDAAGRRVASLGRGTWEAGPGELGWDGRDAAGRRVAPGVYFVRGRTADDRTATARVVIRH